MLGIDDPQIWIAYVLCFLSVFWCIVYGALNWNAGTDEEVVECRKRIEGAEREAVE